ncbi:hypothetical protein ADUPG1_000560, partial [Aduncisulcus paluster]
SGALPTWEVVPTGSIGIDGGYEPCQELRPGQGYLTVTEKDDLDPSGFSVLASYDTPSGASCPVVCVVDGYELNLDTNDCDVVSEVGHYKDASDELVSCMFFSEKHSYSYHEGSIYTDSSATIPTQHVVWHQAIDENSICKCSCMYSDELLIVEDNIFKCISFNDTNIVPKQFFNFEDNIPVMSVHPDIDIHSAPLNESSSFFQVKTLMEFNSSVNDTEVFQFDEDEFNFFRDSSYLPLLDYDECFKPVWKNVYGSSQQYDIFTDGVFFQTFVSFRDPEIAVDTFTMGLSDVFYVLIHDTSTTLEVSIHLHDKLKGFFFNPSDPSEFEFDNSESTFSYLYDDIEYQPLFGFHLTVSIAPLNYDYAGYIAIEEFKIELDSSVLEKIETFLNLRNDSR